MAAANVVTLTDRMTRVATMKSRSGQMLRNLAVEFVGHLPPVRAAFARTLAELDA
jgi:2-polyprenyl-6-methoxyphenol hydroxylase-like FAD-dependent oxidoreductase